MQTLDLTLLVKTYIRPMCLENFLKSVVEYQKVWDIKFSDIVIIDDSDDENNNENLKLYDENNKETEFEQIAVIPLNEKIYAILKPVTKIVGVNDDEALVFSIEEIDDEDCIVLVDDEKVVDEVFKEYYELLKAEGINVD